MSAIQHLLLISSIAGLSLFFAWRYAKSEIDPDWALFNMAAFTGSWYGRDFMDCKSPAIHLWYWALARLVGADIYRVRFLHHLILGLGGIPVAYMSGSFWNGLAFSLLINSGWLLTFHGNVGQVPALLLALMLLIENGWIGMALLAPALFFEPKLLPTAFIVIIINNWYLPAIIYMLPAAGIVIILKYRYRNIFDWLWECNITIPKRMQEKRKADRLFPYNWSPFFTSQGLLYLLPWIIFAAYARPDIEYWLPAATYAIFIGYGWVIRPNHLIPLIAWIAVANISPLLILILIVIDLLASGFYLGDIWFTFYPALRDHNIIAREIGKFLRDKEGPIWINSYLTQIYIHARKPILYAMTEQAEMETICYERRAEFKKRWKANPPKWVVCNPHPGINFKSIGYKLVNRAGDAIIFRKEV